MGAWAVLIIPRPQHALRRVWKWKMDPSKNGNFNGENDDQPSFFFGWFFFFGGVVYFLTDSDSVKSRYSWVASGIQINIALFHMLIYLDQHSNKDMLPCRFWGWIKHLKPKMGCFRLGWILRHISYQKSATYKSHEIPIFLWFPIGFP